MGGAICQKGTSVKLGIIQPVNGPDACVGQGVASKVDYLAYNLGLLSL